MSGEQNNNRDENYYSGSVLAGFWEKAGGLFAPRWMPGKTYGRFYRQYAGILTFSVLFTFFSSYGQTFLLSLFQPYWIESFSLTSGGVGQVYGIATLMSGLLLPWIGKYLDVVSPRRFAVITALSLGIWSLLMAVSWHPWVLFLSLFALRFTGQGVSTNLAKTTVAKYFREDRGKALSITGLGFPMGEMVFPLLLASLIPILGWRAVWGVMGILALGFLLPVSQILYRPRHDHEIAAVTEKDSGPSSAAFLFRDWKFYLMVTLMIPMPFLSTGIIFYQANLMEERGWSIALFASAFPVFALLRAVFSLTAGTWIDRWNARKLLGIQMTLFAAGLGVLLIPSKIALFAFFVFLGFSYGLAGSMMTAVWVEVYGTRLLGRIRGMTSSVGVFSTALSPIIFGFLINRGMTPGEIISASFLIVLLVLVPLAWFATWFLHKFEDASQG